MALALETATGLVGVHDDVARQATLPVPSASTGGQVMVGDQHLQAQRAGVRHAGVAGNAVVHRHQHTAAACAMARSTMAGVRP